MRLPFGITSVRFWDAYAIRQALSPNPYRHRGDRREGGRTAGEDATRLQLAQLPITSIMVPFAPCSPRAATGLQLAALVQVILEL